METAKCSTFWQNRDRMTIKNRNQTIGGGQQLKTSKRDNQRLYKSKNSIFIYMRKINGIFIFLSKLENNYFSFMEVDLHLNDDIEGTHFIFLLRCRWLLNFHCAHLTYLSLAKLYDNKNWVQALINSVHFFAFLFLYPQILFPKKLRSQLKQNQ